MRVMPNRQSVTGALQPEAPSHAPVTGTDGPDTLIGTAGADELYGYGGDDVLNALGGDDWLSGGDGADSLYGGDGADRLLGGAGADLLDGGAGDDWLQQWETGGDRMIGGSGADRFSWNLNSTSSTPGASDVIADFSTSEGDRLDIGATDGQLGHYLRLTGALSGPVAVGQTISGGRSGVTDVWTWVDGDQTVLFVDRNDNQRVDATDFLLRLDGRPTITQASFLPGTFVAQFGTDGSDAWVGTGGDDLYFGEAGDDVAGGEGGADTIFGGDGNDTLSGGAGADRLVGQRGNDTLRGGEGDDTLYAGMDVNSGLSDFGTENWLYGEGGADTLIGGEGRDHLYGGDGDDVLDSRRSPTPGSDVGVDELFGGAGNDRFAIDGDLADGGDGDDFFQFGTRGSDVRGGAGADTFYVPSLPTSRPLDFAAFDVIRDFDQAEGDLFDYTMPSRGAGLLVFRGDIANPGFVLQAGSAYSPDDYGPGFMQLWTYFDGRQTWVMLDADQDGKVSTGDHFLALDGRITLTAAAFVEGSFDTFAGGTTGDDVWTGTAGNEVWYGLSGNDTITGGGGYDELYGGAGDDVIRLGDLAGLVEGGLGSDVIYGGAGADRLIGYGGGSSTQSNPEDLDVIYGGGGNDQISAGFIGQARLYGEDGDDSIAGVGELYGGAGNDGLRGRGLLDGGDGDDRLQVEGGGENVLRGGAGADQLTGGLGADRLEGGADADDLSGSWGDDMLVGGTGDDRLFGGDGYDVAGYEGARRNYASVTSTGVSGGREGGADTLVGIEAAAFVDGLTTFNADSQAAQLMRLYSAALDRAPDALGFQIQLDAIEAGVTFNEMARRFLTSDEFTGRFGALTNTQYIQRLYQNAFDRQPSNAEINDWLTYLNAGNSRQALMVVIAESAESRAATWSTLSAGLWVGDAVSESLARMFDTVFDRLPDEGGLITWRASMAGGATLLDVATAFLASAEGQSRYAGLSNAQFVDAVYQAALNRAPDSGGQATYLAALNSGALTRAQMLVSVSESAEHQALTLPVYVGGIPTQTAPAPAPPEGAHDDPAGPQTLPATDDAKHHDDGAQTLPALDDGGKDDGAQTLPADPDGGAVDAKDGGPQVIPAIDDGAQVVPVADAGKDAGAQVVPALSDDDFVPLALVDAGAQTTPLHVAVDLDALFASHDQIGVERALDALPMVAVDPLDATHPGGGDAHHLGHDAFQ